jgi:hypothetical protein
MNSSKSAVTLGFLTCTEFEGWGLCGGLLLLNPLARPLEFHCTLPVKVTRTQSILFGASLRAYICGQVIGKALLEKSKTRPSLLLTDCPDTATLHEENDLTLAFVSTPANRELAASVGEDWESLELRQTPVRVHFPDDGFSEPMKREVRQVLETFTDKFDLDEPFERVRQAITEARDAALRAA